MFCKIKLLITLLLVIPATTQAAIYKCIIDGENYFQSKPCPSSAEERQTIRANPSNDRPQSRNHDLYNHRTESLTTDRIYNDYRRDVEREQRNQDNRYGDYRNDKERNYKDREKRENQYRQDKYKQDFERNRMKLEHERKRSREKSVREAQRYNEQQRREKEQRDWEWRREFH